MNDNKEYEFLSIIECKKDDIKYVGIINNIDKSYLSYYDINDIENNANEFIKICKKWWEETNRCTPINIIFEVELRPFKKYIKLINKNNIKIITGNNIHFNKNLYYRSKNNYIIINKE